VAFDPQSAYSAGLMGCQPSPRSDEVFADYILRHGGDPDGGAVAHEWEFADAGKGKLTLLFPAVERVFPGAFPGPAQLTGDCVARATANCILTTMSVEIDEARTDEVSGRIEGAPELPKAGIEQGVVAAESLWAWRGYDRDGWICSESAKVASENGFLIRKPYPDLKIDLTKYTDDTIRIGGSRVPGQKWLDESKQHLVRTATFVKGREQVRDFLAAGYAVFTCSALGFENVRNEDGVSRQTKVWHHAQLWHGYDDRPETIQKYGQALVLWQNSWNKWNSGPRKIRGTQIEIPHGAFWALASTIDRCTCIALSSVAGWPRRKHTTYGATGNI
jgi:hypothetical protein